MVLSHQKRTRVDDQATPGPSSPAQRFLLIVHLNWPCSGYPTFSEPPPKNCILRLCEFVWKLQIAGCFSYVKLHFYCLKPSFFKDRWHSQGGLSPRWRAHRRHGKMARNRKGSIESCQAWPGDVGGLVRVVGVHLFLGPTMAVWWLVDG